jgi:hypothetical protein
MNGRESTQSLLILRKLTRAIADTVRAQMTEYLATLAPLLRPKMVLGDYVEDGSKESTRRSDKALKDLQTLYEKVAATKPFNLPRELTLPLRLSGTGLEITAVDTPHVIQSGSESRTIMVRSPLTWTLTYAGHAPTRLPELLKTKLRAADELNQLVLSYLLMHVVITNSPGLMQAFEALHFPVTTTTLPELGPLPITRIGVDISTTRPADAVILEVAELTGMDAFEEVVNVDDLANLRDPLKERLLEIARQQAPELV